MAENIKTLVLGASTSPSRYSYKAIMKLTEHGHDVAAIGLREGEVAGVPITREMEAFENIHTVTLYLGPANQKQYLNYIIGLKPERIVFNPGTYNPELDKMAEAAGIETVSDCTLVMLDLGDY